MLAIDSSASRAAEDDETAFLYMHPRLLLDVDAKITSCSDYPYLLVQKAQCWCAGLYSYYSPPLVLPDRISCTAPDTPSTLIISPILAMVYRLHFLLGFKHFVAMIGGRMTTCTRKRKGSENEKEIITSAFSEYHL